MRCYIYETKESFRYCHLQQGHPQDGPGGISPPKPSPAFRAPGPLLPPKAKSSRPGLAYFLFPIHPASFRPLPSPSKHARRTLFPRVTSGFPRSTGGRPGRHGAQAAPAPLPCGTGAPGGREHREGCSSRSPVPEPGPPLSPARPRLPHAARGRSSDGDAGGEAARTGDVRGGTGGRGRDLAEGGSFRLLFLPLLFVLVPRGRWRLVGRRPRGHGVTEPQTVLSWSDPQGSLLSAEHNPKCHTPREGHGLLRQERFHCDLLSFVSLLVVSSFGVTCLI